jgi:hypothetical protein
MNECCRLPATSGTVGRAPQTVSQSEWFHRFGRAVAMGAAHFRAIQFLSLAPGFSRVNAVRRIKERFQPFPTPATAKPLKRLGAGPPAPTGLKPGANEKLQKSEMRPVAICAGQLH